MSHSRIENVYIDSVNAQELLHHVFKFPKLYCVMCIQGDLTPRVCSLLIRETSSPWKQLCLRFYSILSAYWSQRAAEKNGKSSSPNICGDSRIILQSRASTTTKMGKNSEVRPWSIANYVRFFVL